MNVEIPAWYCDTRAEGMGEPGLAHSFVGALATALTAPAVTAVRGEVDPVELMGASGFAFRVFVNEVFCPSAMSMFSFRDILPEAVEQAGLTCRAVHRLRDEEEVEEERRGEAHAAIAEAAGRGVPAVVWDVAEAEWGVVTGLDEEAGNYFVLTPGNGPGILPFGKLGRNGIDILSVLIPGEPNGRTGETIRHRALAAAVAHADGEEWTDRPRYANGRAAFDLWAELLEKWALLAGAGKNADLAPQVPECAGYYARITGGARCYARDWLERIAGSDEHLKQAAATYARIADCLRPQWETFPGELDPAPDLLGDLAGRVREAGRLEAEAIDHVRNHLTAVTAE